MNTPASNVKNKSQPDQSALEIPYSDSGSEESEELEESEESDEGVITQKKRDASNTTQVDHFTSPTVDSTPNMKVSEFLWRTASKEIKENMFQVQLKPNFLVSFDETLSLPGTAIVAGGSLGVIQEVDKAKHTVSISSTHLSAGKKSKTFSRKTTAIHHPCNHMLFSGVAQQLPYKLLGPTSPLWEHEHMYFMTRLIIGNLSNSSPPASQWDLLYGTVLHVNPALNGSDCYILVGFTLMNSQIQVPRYKRTNLYEPEQEYKVLLLKASRALFSEDNELELKQRNFRRWGITILPFLHILPLQNFLQWFQVGGNGDTKVQFSRGLIEHLDASAQSDIVRLCDCTMQLIYNIAGGVTEVSSRDGNDESLRVMKLLCGQNNFEGELGAYSEHDDASFHSLPEICFDGQKSAMKKTSNMAQVRDDNHLPDSEASRLVPHSKGRNYQAERDPIGGTASDPPVQEPEEDIPSNRSSKPTKRKTTARKGRSKQKRSKATDLDTDAEDDDFSQQYPHAKLTISEKKNPIRTAYKLSHYLALKEHELAKAEENVKLTLEAMNTQKLVDDLKIKNSRIEIEELQQNVVNKDLLKKFGDEMELRLTDMMNIFRTKLEATLTKGINELSRKRKHDSLGDDVVLTKRKRVDEPNTVPPAPPSTASDKIQPDASSPSAKTAHGTYGSTPIPAGSMEHAPVQLQYQTPAPPPGTESDKIQPDATSPSVKTTHGTYSSVPTSAGSMEHVQIHYQSSAPPPETASDKIQPGGSSYGTYSSAPISAGLISDAYERPVQIHYRPPPPPYGTASHKNQQDSSSASPRTSSYVAYGSAPTSGFERPVHIPYHPHVVQNNPSARLQQQGHIASSVGPFSPNTDPMHRTSYVMPPVPFDHQQRQLQQSQQYLQMHQDHDLFMQQQQQLRQAPQYLGYNFNQNPHHVAGQSFHMQHMEAFPSQSPRSAEPDPNYRI